MDAPARGSRTSKRWAELRLRAAANIARYDVYLGPRTNVRSRNDALIEARRVIHEQGLEYTNAASSRILSVS